MQRYFFLHLAALFYTFTDNCKQQLTCLIVNESLSIETCRVYFAAIYEIRDSVDIVSSVYSHFIVRLFPVAYRGF